MLSTRTLSGKVVAAILLTLLTVVSFIVVSFIGMILEAGFCLQYFRMVLIAGILVTVVGLLVVRWRRSHVLIALYIGLLAAIAVYWLPPTSRNLFLNNLYSIKPGMTVAQVEARMKPDHVYSRGKCLGDYDGPGWPEQAHGGETDICYRHSDTHEYGGDLGVVVFRRGKVVYIYFSPD